MTRNQSLRGPALLLGLLCLGLNRPRPVSDRSRRRRASGGRRCIGAVPGRLRCWRVVLTRAAFGLLLALTTGLRAVTIEYSYFEPDRARDSQAMQKQWGADWTWPLKTFPRHQQNSPDLKTAYGLVYWPGEEVTVHVKGDGAVVDRITCTDAVGTGDLAAERKADDGRLWTIRIPPLPEPAADSAGKPVPYLKVYRVRAYSGEREVAARGLIVTRPWSGVRAVHGDPYYFRCGVSFGEWCNGSNPWCVMSFMVGYHTFLEDYFPMRNRPWGSTDVFGLAEIHDWPRVAGQQPKPPSYTSASYADPTLDWNSWWIYYGRGASKWRGEWQWGPFSLMSVEHVTDRQHTYDYGVCYGQVKQYSAALPNGLLFWQWGYYGLNRLAAHMMKVRQPQFTYDTYDGWEEGLGDEGRSEEVGIIGLYYRRCLAQGFDTDWATSGASFGEFRAAQAAAYQKDRLNDFNLRFRSLDLNRRNFWMYERATDNAYREVTGHDRDYYGGAIGQPGMIDRVPFSGLRQDKRWIGALWNDPFNNGRGGHTGTGNDYSHTGVVSVGSDWFRNSRWYRGFGYNGGTTCALWPQMYYGGGHNHERVMPLRPGALRTERDWMPYDRFVIDGTSYRRMDIFERVPMFYRAKGVLTSYELAFCFGGSHAGSDNSSYSEVPLWNTQAVLGSQVMEIPDRVRPIGGVFVFDSNNDTDRKGGREFLTEQPFSDLLAAVHELLGIVTYANPDTEKDIPADVPVVYAPRLDGAGHPVLTARVAGKTLSVPYTGPAMQLPASPEFQAFVRQVKAACPDGWPLATTGGFVASAWESSSGVFAAVENPMDGSTIHTARTGSVTVRVRGLRSTPVVVDLCGDEPDPQRLADADVSVKGEFVTFRLNWPRGDTRLFWIPPAQPDPR